MDQQAVVRHLLKNDIALRPVFNRVPFPAMKASKDIYAALLYSIISQQLSVKAADTIHRRFCALFEHEYPDPKSLSRKRVTTLRKAGLSLQKAGYVQGVARFALKGGLDFKRLSDMCDESLIAHLTQIKGVGRWTVEMMLMFAMARPDVFSADDLGIQKAMIRLYGLDGSNRRLLKQNMNVIACRWQPYRTVVCKSLWSWNSLD